MTVLIIHHVRHNRLGSLETILAAHGQQIAYVDCHRIEPAHLDLTDVSGLILLGGMDSVTKIERPPYMNRERLLIRNAIAAELTVFGICFGAQMLAHTLGGAVSRNQIEGKPQKELGWQPLTLSPAGEADPVMRHLAGCAQFQWHEDTYELPPGATHLASTALCQQQAFRLDLCKQHVYGVQFHPEITLDVIQEWLRISRSLSEPAKQVLWEESQAGFAQWHSASRTMFQAFCKQAF